MNINRSIKLFAGVALLAAILSSCTGANTQNNTSPTSNSSQPLPTEVVEMATETSSAGTKDPVRMEANGEVPFYARFGENETFSDGERTVIVFYRPPGCIPADFNLNQFFHFPAENSQGAFACAPPTTTSVEYWANGPDTDPAPLIAEMTGRGAVPVWFIAEADVQQAMEDGTVTIGELSALPSRLAGEAAIYTELLHPSQTNAKALLRFNAEGTLEDGRSFRVHVSYGVPDVEDQTTIEIQ